MGFTMIEVLIVMLILGILATIAFVSLGPQRQRAWVAAAVASVKGSMAPAMVCKSMNAEGFHPPDVDGGEAICSGSKDISESVVWPVLSNGCHYCPMDGNRVEFNCGVCDQENKTNSFCDIASLQCETHN